MELCKKDLFDLVVKVGPLKDDSLIRYIFSELCSGVHALHTETQYAHLDIKLENFLIGQDFKLKLCDLGFA